MTVHLVKLFVAMLVSLLAISFGVAYTGYAGRRDLIASQRAGCERGKLDRRDNARGWRTAEARATSQGQLGFAAVYSGIAAGLEARSRVSCEVAFPTARFWP